MLSFKQVKKISKKKFIEDVIVLQCGSFILKVIAAITSIVFARILGADNYGVYGLIFAFVGLVSIAMDMGTGYAVLTLLPAAYNQKNKREIKNILSYFFYITLFISLAVGSLIIALSPFLTKLIYHNAEIGVLARYIILSLIISIFFSLLSLTLQSIRRIKLLTAIENLDKIIFLIVPVSFVLLGYGLWGIVFGNLVSTIFCLVGSIFLFNYISRKNRLIPSLFEILNNFKEVSFKKYFKFGILISINRNLDNLYAIFPVIFLGMFAATTSQVAYFKIAVGYLGLPLVFMTAISRISIVQLSKSLVYGKDVFKKNFKIITLLSGLIFILLLIPWVMLSSVLIRFFYGQEYLSSVKLVYILSLGWILSGFAVCYSGFFRTLNKLNSLLFINLFVILSGIALFFVLNNFISPLRAIIVLYIYFGLGEKIIRSLFIFRYFKKMNPKCNGDILSN